MKRNLAIYLPSGFDFFLTLHTGQRNPEGASRPLARTTRVHVCDAWGAEGPAHGRSAAKLQSMALCEQRYPGIGT